MLLCERPSWFRLLGFLAVAACGIGLIGGCEPAADPPARIEATTKLPGNVPVLLIGVDGLEWDLIVPLVEAGKLPNLADLMRMGQYGRLQSFEPTYSPVIWTSVATGKRPEDHGISNFAYYDLQGELRLFDNGRRKTKAVWNIVSDYGKRVCTPGRHHCRRPSHSPLEDRFGPGRHGTSSARDPGQRIRRHPDHPGGNGSSDRPGYARPGNGASVA